MPSARWALLAGSHALGAALDARLPGRLAGEWTRFQNAPDPAAAGERYDGVVLCPGVPFSSAPPPRAEPGVRNLAWMTSSRVGRLVLLSSTAIYSPRMAHPGLVREGDARTLRPLNPEARRWRDLELRVAEVAAAGAIPLTVLRPAPVPLAGGDDFWSRLLCRRLAPVLAGYDPSVQLLGIDDLVEAIARALQRGRHDVYHIAPAGVVPLRAALRLAGAQPVPGARLLSAARLIRPVAPLHYIRHSFTVSGDRATRELALPAARTSAAVARSVSSYPSLEATTEEPGPNPDDDSWDELGYDPALCDRLGRTLWRFAHDVWWRVEVAGLEHVPRQGGAVLAGIHRGYMPLDAIMLLHLFRRDLGRPPRFLVHPALLKVPFSASFIVKTGGVVACQENADFLLARGDIVGVLPEGARGAFSEYRDAYTLKKFGRDDFVRIALRNGVPILPFVTIGPAESMPIFRLLQWRWWKKTMGWPGFPLTPTFPFLPPLPTRWHTLFLPPMHVEAEYPPEAADDRAVVHRISARYRKLMEENLTAMLRRRRSIWRGSIFGGDRDSEGAEA